MKDLARKYASSGDLSCLYIGVVVPAAVAMEDEALSTDSLDLEALASLGDKHTGWLLTTPETRLCGDWADVIVVAGIDDSDG